MLSRYETYGSSPRWRLPRFPVQTFTRLCYWLLHLVKCPWQCKWKTPLHWDLKVSWFQTDCLNWRNSGLFFVTSSFSTYFLPFVKTWMCIVDTPSISSGWTLLWSRQERRHDSMLYKGTHGGISVNMDWVHDENSSLRKNSLWYICPLFWSYASLLMKFFLSQTFEKFRLC